MKNLQLCLILALFVINAFCQVNLGGSDSVTVRANDDPGACLLTVSAAKTSPTEITFTETVYNPNWDCTYQNLTFTSWFPGFPTSGSVDLIQNPSNSSQWVGKLTIAMIQQQNGSACFNLAPRGVFAYDYYLCRFRYAYVDVTMFVLIYANNTFAATLGEFYPMYGATNLVSKNSTIVWAKGNDSYANVVGQMYSQCGGWSTNIPSGSNEVYITGTIYSSNQISLQQSFSGNELYSAIIRKKNAPASDYIVSFINNYAFNSAPVSGNCSDIGIHYNNIVPDMNYCSNGCHVAIYMRSSTTYVLQTNGFTYAPPSLRA